MSKIISYKHLSIGAVLFAAAFALQFVPALSRAQAPVKPASPPASQAQPALAPAASPVVSIVKPNAGALTPVQEAPLRRIAEGPLEIVFKFTAAILKPILALKPGETMQILTPEQKSGMQVAAIAERNSKGYCLYVQEEIRFTAPELMRVARAQSGFGLGLIIDKVLAQNSATVTFDKNFPNSVCFENVRRAFTFFGNITFAQSIVNEVLAQGAALLAEAKAASCPRNIQKLAANIENACTRIKNVPQCYIARQAALKKLLMKDKKFVNCAISDYITLPMFDWGDADPAVTGRTTAAQKGPFAAVNQKLKLGKIVNGERDANIIDNDGDDGLTRVAAGVMGGTYEVRSTALVGAQRVFLTIDRFVRPGVVERLRNGPVGTGEAVTNIGKLKDGLYRIYLTSHPVPGPGVGKTGQAPGGNLGTGEIEDWSIPLTKQNGVVCAAVLDYVCGVNGQTYNNECEAGRAGVKVAAKGKCPPPVPPKPPGDGCPEAPAVQCAQGTVPQTSVGADGCQVTTCVPSGGQAATYDFGDAARGFPTLLSENGPRHVLSNRVWLGDRIDGESDGLRTNRDDEVGVDDEDGMLNSNPQFVLLVRTGPNLTTHTVYINAWEDWNANNRWDINANGAPGDEWIVRNQPVQVGSNTVQNALLVQPRNGPDGQPLPAAWSDPAFWVRFTVTETRIPNGNPALGQFPSGETEDYIGVPPPAPSVPGVPGGDRGLDASGASVPTGGGGAAAGGIEIKL